MFPIFFAKPSDFRKWLAKNHETAGEILVGFYKVGSGKPSITWPESVDQALCVGWIDGVRRRIDDESYSIRFTPRKPTSIWSTFNIKKMHALIENGLAAAAGISAFEMRTEARSRVYAYENEAQQLSADFDKRFRANRKAWNFFNSQAPSYRHTVIHWVMRAKRETTRISRFEKMMAASEGGERLF